MKTRQEMSSHTTDPFLSQSNPSLLWYDQQLRDRDALPCLRQGRDQLVSKYTTKFNALRLCAGLAKDTISLQASFHTAGSLSGVKEMLVSGGRRMCNLSFKELGWLAVDANELIHYINSVNHCRNGHKDCVMTAPHSGPGCCNTSPNTQVVFA